MWLSGSSTDIQSRYLANERIRRSPTEAKKELGLMLITFHE